MSKHALLCQELEASVGTKEITVETEIIETIIEDLLYLAEDDDEAVVERERKRDIIGFDPVHNDQDEIEHYRSTI